MKKILITGGTGFVGRNLQEQLSDRYEIFAPSHKELELLDYDALEQYVTEHGINSIVHSAIHVPMFNGAEKEFFNDMQMFANLEKISHRVEKLLYFGSGAEFDKRYDIDMVKEEEIGKTIPTSEYGLAKYTMNLIARQSKNIYNLRLFGIFGKYELWNIKFLSGLCCKALFDLPLTVRKDCRFDFFAIEDLGEIVSWFLENQPQYHDYNICQGKPYYLTELAQIVRKVSGKDLTIQLLSDERNVDYCADNTRLRSQISDIQITPLEKSIEKLYNYYASNRDLIDVEILKKSI